MAMIQWDDDRCKLTQWRIEMVTKKTQSPCDLFKRFIVMLTAEIKRLELAIPLTAAELARLLAAVPPDAERIKSTKRHLQEMEVRLPIARTDLQDFKQDFLENCSGH
jgi:hypothetical protein